MLFWAARLLVLAWVPPPRRSLRGPRTAAGTGLGRALLPVVSAVPLGVAGPAS
ncbi:hypothetical protein ACWD0Z_18635 [Streptomyces sp. NPDC003007]